MRKYLACLLVVLMVLASTVGVSASIYDKWEGELGRTPRVSGETMDASGYVEINYVKGQQAYNLNIYTEGLLEGYEYEVFFRTGLLSGGSPVDTFIGQLTPYYDSDLDKVIGIFSENHRTSARLNIETVLSSPNPRVIVSKGGNDYILNTIQGEDLEPVGSNRGQ